jgi:site-specific DNA recombinase
MQGSWNNDQSYYRCTYPNEYARTNNIDHPRVVYLREAEILSELDTWLAKSLDPARLPATIEALAASQDDVMPRELVSLRDEIAVCDQKLTQYRAALDSGADAAVVGQWITETQARKLVADARLRAATGTRPGPERMTNEQIAATVRAIRELTQALRDATSEGMAEIYAGLNLQLTYNPGERTVAVRAGIGQTCTKGSWANDKTLLISGYGMFARRWSRLKRADLPALWVLRAVRRVRWRWLRVR